MRPVAYNSLPARTMARLRRTSHRGRLVLGLATITGLLALLAPWTAAAQVVELPEAHVDSEREQPLSTGVAAVVDTENLAGSGDSAADAVESVPGVEVRRFGGSGSYSAIGIRGLGPENVAVVLDDMPLSSATLGPLDLSLYPVESIERIEVYRGGGPVRFAGPLGGVLRLVTRTPRDHTTLSAHAGYGSYGSRSAHAAAAGPWLAAGLRYSAYAGYEGSKGDYEYYDDQETLYTSDDDRVTHRRNNASDAAVLRLGLERDLPRGATLRIQSSGAWRDQGVPGRGAVPTERSHARQLEGTARAGITGLTFWGGRGRLAAGTDLLASERRFRDPLGETGLEIPREDSRLVQAGADARLELLESLSHESEVSLRISWDRFRSEGPFATPALERSRLTLGAGLEHRADLAASLRLVPALRVDAARDTGAGTGGTGFVTGTSPRLGLLWIARPCELRANAAWFFRLPSLLERFGDGVTTKASPDLAPERGLSADLGGTCKLRPPLVDRLEVQVVGFATEASQLIALVPNSQRWMLATNVGRSRILGVESKLDARVAWVRVELAYTFTHARDRSGRLGYDGNQTPGVPTHRLDAALQIGPTWAWLRYELALTSTTFLDRANLRPVPLRALHSVRAAARLGKTGFVLEVSVHNLLDTMAERVPVRGAEDGTGMAALSDFLGFPLPGRTWLASLLWRQP